MATYPYRAVMNGSTVLGYVQADTVDKAVNAVRRLLPDGVSFDVSPQAVEDDAQEAVHSCPMQYSYAKRWPVEDFRNQAMCYALFSALSAKEVGATNG